MRKKEIQVQPHDYDLERAVLGAMMLEAHCLPEALSRLHEDAFYHELHRRVYVAISRLYDQSRAIDLHTVVAEMKALNLLNETHTPYEVVKITNDVVSSAHIEDHIKLLLQYFMQREMISVGHKLISRGHTDDVFDLMDGCAAEIMKLQESALKGRNKSIVDHVVAACKERDEVIANEGVIGTPTGMKPLDEAIGGLAAPDLVIVAGRPGMGKTAFVLSILSHVSMKLKEPVGVFSMEMKATQLVNRLASMESGVSHDKVRNGQMNEGEWARLTAANELIASSSIHIDDVAGLNAREIRTKASIMKRKYGIKHLIVDYLQLMSGTGSGKNREGEISEISRTLKLVAKELDICVIALSQLSREVEKRTDKMPQLSDLRESGAIEQDADGVIFLMRPEYYEMIGEFEIGGQMYDPKGLVITKIAKYRHGHPKGIALFFDGPTMTFSGGNNPIFPNPGNWKPIKDFTELKEPF